ncbi:hypothetical protein RFI_10080 [Reticulomyxa filosa]|uniref:Serine-tRNA synthetase type1 N-terminal domain-containing protein n=1 Tax=Reticulomyxa filosa TaxID=46433 RepID=X6NNU9_RETFI|nr:hypothetical protein RFI_10080 [Reticulomyxa filosa]|eukprot:ETO27052.1 hypothetical protein RFI_10080 [Reticulomyxa filosa]
MPIDLQLFRKDQGGNPELIEESQKRRFKNTKIVSDIIELDRVCRQQTGQLDNINKDMRNLSKQVGEIMKKVSFWINEEKFKKFPEKFLRKKRPFFFQKKKKDEMFLTPEELAEVEKLKKQKEDMEQARVKLEEDLEAGTVKRNKLMNQIGNIVHESVPISNDEKDNGLVREWGKVPQRTGKEKHHHELLWMLSFSSNF